MMNTTAATPLKRPSVVRLILDVFRERILSGQYAAGKRLPTIDELAVEFRVSRSSVREAMRVLDVIGLVEMRQGDGTYIAAVDADFASVPLTWGLPISPKTQRDLIEMRLILEVAAAGLAASQRGSEQEAMDLAIRHLREARDPMVAAEADLDFHLALARSTGNAILPRALHGIRSLLRPVFVEALRRDGVRERAAMYHAAILEAIAIGDSDLAKKAMTEHLSFVADMWLGPDTERGVARGDGSPDADDVKR
jgi:GntR family transcriptional repressor for pyruvate dehydrogenase complex